MHSHIIMKMVKGLPVVADTMESFHKTLSNGGSRMRVTKIMSQLRIKLVKI